MKTFIQKSTNALLKTSNPSVIALMEQSPAYTEVVESHSEASADDKKVKVKKSK